MAKVKVDKVGWRVDVNISTSSAHHLLTPSVLMNLELSDGSSQLLDLDVRSFSQLRCKVAELLAQLNFVQEKMQAKTLPQMRKIDS
ncbi:uncharacterized protein LOC131874583 [Cryptomeria japonica]|uniref:uncharacterized protein LOC131874583 n=1 Tax=Cryptomeria japonica TaxID=3369 RepID=UPI0027DA59D9|nr:uncharacterized protein LOC131874583 [Cryptomeria japonica]